MSNNISIRNIDPQQITISGAGQPTGITNVYVNGVDVTVGTKAYVVVPTDNNELLNGAGYITAAEETDPTVPSYVKAISPADINSWNDKQDQLVSGSTIKTINSESLLGSGNIEIVSNYVAGDGIDITDNVISNTITSYNELSDTPTIPTKTSDLVNDSGFITNQTDRLVNYLTTEVLENILPHTSDSGSGDLYLEDSVKYKIKMELNPSEIEQITYSGAQLFDKENMNTINGYYIDGTGKIVAGATNNLCWIELESNTDYYLYQDIVSNVTRRPTLYNSEPNIGDTGTVLTTISGTNSIDFTFNTGGSVYLAWVYFNSQYPNGHTEQEMIDSIMINQGTTHEDYEPYVGGMPSPSISYPQQLHTTRGDISITVCGKNLYDGVEYNRYINSLGNVGTSTNYLGIEDSIKCLPSTQYAVSFQHDNPTANLYVAYKDSEGNLISRTSYLTARTFTTPNNAVSMFPYLNKSGVTFDTVGGYVQIERGSTATSYVPYQSQEYDFNFNSVGTISRRNYVKIQGSNRLYKDRLFINNPNDPDYSDSRTYNGVYVKLDNLFLQLTSSFNWIDGGVEEAGTHTYKIENYSTLYTAIEPTLIYCEYFTTNGKDKITLNNDGTLKVQIDDNNNINSLDDFKAWLDELGILGVYTPTSYPIYMELEGTIMGNAYKNMTNNITAYEGGTNISQEYDDLPLIIEADTLKKIS